MVEPLVEPLPFAPPEPQRDIAVGVRKRVPGLDGDIDGVARYRPGAAG